MTNINSNLESSSPASAVAPAEVRHNLICCLLLNAFWLTGWTDIVIALQPLLVYLGASNKVIGIISGVAGMGIFGSFASPWITRHFCYKKWYVFVVNALYMIPVAMVGVIIVFSHVLHLSTSGLLTVVIVSMLVHQFLAGFVTLPTQEFLAACIPMNYRGRLSGYSSSLGGLAAIGSSAIGGWILWHYAKPMSFGYLFILTSLICQGSFLFALLARETPTPVEKSPAPWSRQMFKDFWHDKPFLRVTLLNAVGVITFFSITPFINIYGFRELKMAAATSAIIQVVGQAVRIGLGSFVGIVTDKYKPQRVMPYLIAINAASLLPPILIPNAYGVYLSVGLSCLCAIGWSGALWSLYSGLPKPEHRAGHMTFAVLISTVAGTLGSVGMGWLCDHVAFRTAFTGVLIWAMVFVVIARQTLATVETNAPANMNPSLPDTCIECIDTASDIRLASNEAGARL